MNKERLEKIIEDFQECLADIDECLEILNDNKKDKLMKKLAGSSLRNLFVSFHTILEDFCSIMLKEIKKYKIGITLHESFKVLNENGIFNEELLNDLDKSRLIRNRISHRYKEPTNEQLLKHMMQNKSHFKEIVIIAKKYL